MRSRFHRCAFARVNLALLASALAVIGCSPQDALGPPGLPSAPQLPTSAPYSQTRVITPATGGNALHLPLPAGSGYAGQASFPVASVPANLKITVTYTNRIPAGIAKPAALHVRTTAASRHAFDASNTEAVYACFSANQTVALDGAPAYAFVLPPGFAPSAAAYYLALWQNGWVDGYGGPGSIVAQASSTTVTIGGRFAFTIPANASVCVALYSRSSSASTPAPAPLPAASTTPIPVVIATASPSPSPTMPPAGLLTVDPSSLALAGIGSVNAEPLVVGETDYRGPFTERDTCVGIATVASLTTLGSVRTAMVTGLHAGSCVATFADASGQAVSSSISVTTGGFTIQAVRPIR